MQLGQGDILFTPIIGYEKKVVTVMSSIGFSKDILELGLHQN